MWGGLIKLGAKFFWQLDCWWIRIQITDSNLDLKHWLFVNKVEYKWLMSEHGAGKRSLASGLLTASAL
jgi:hypothetical protein